MMNGSVPLARPSKLPCSAYSTMSSAKHLRSPDKSGISSGGAGLPDVAANASSLQSDAVGAPSELAEPPASIRLRSPDGSRASNAEEEGDNEGSTTTAGAGS